jgi:DNA-binding MarR family transcriptional regulator
LTPILKKLEAMGYVERARDPADERQVRVTLTASGKRVREKAFGTDLAEACGISTTEFKRLQKEIVALRTNLLEFAGKDK